MYKNIEKQTMLNLKDLVEYQEGQVVSKTLVQNDYVSMTIFSFDKGEEISTHAAGGDAMVTVLEGKGRFTAACILCGRSMRASRSPARAPFARSRRRWWSSRWGCTLARRAGRA